MLPLAKSVPLATAKRIFRYAMPYWRLHLAALVCSLIVTAVSFAVPYSTKLLVDDVFMGNTIDSHHQFSAIRYIAFLITASILINTLGSILRTYFFSKAGELATADLRRRLFGHLHYLPMSYFDARKTGGIMSVLHSDVEVLQGLYSSTIVDIISNGFFLLTASVIMFCISPLLSIVSLPIPIIFVYNLSLFYHSLEKAGTQVREHTAETQEVLQESISGTREVRLFAREKAELDRYMQKISKLVSSRINLSVRVAICSSTANSLSSVGLILLIVIGSLIVIRNPQHLSAGSLVFFINIFFMLFNPANMFANIHNQLASTMGAANRIFTFLDSPVEKDTPVKPDISSIMGHIQFHDVTFCYERDQSAINHVDVDIRSQETMALVGPSGAGKTTLASLILRLYDPTEGSISIDGVDIRSIPLAWLRSSIAFVPQEPFLFSTTIAENISLGCPEAKLEDVIQAAREANAHDFINALPQGYDTDVGERGARLSVGQKQRIAVARAFLKNPRILILDEATSAQDTESERLLQEATKRLMERRTSLIIAHRFSTAMWADRILVLEHGRIVGLGTHMELLRNCEMYARLYEMSGIGRNKIDPTLAQHQSQDVV